MWPAELATDGAALVLPVLDLMDRGLDVGVRASGWWVRVQPTWVAWM